MRHVILIALLAFIHPNSSFGQNTTSAKYADFRQGKFTYGKQFIFNGDTLEFADDSNLDTVIVVREKLTQIEFYPGEANQFSLYYIRWLADDKYELTLAESTKDLFAKGDKIVVQILSRTDNTYYYESVSKLGTVRCTLIKRSD